MDRQIAPWSLITPMINHIPIGKLIITLVIKWESQGDALQGDHNLHHVRDKPRDPLQWSYHNHDKLKSERK